jgi:4-amino-4-deoxy-L-arabinose transferase-like glycosyltransferase
MNETNRTLNRMWPAWIVVMTLTLPGFILRLVYLLGVSPHVDEYSTMWAARQIIERGLPVLPSGFIYLQGLLFTYLDALSLALFGLNEIEVIARLPSLIVGMASILLVYRLGRRMFSGYVGFLAAVLLALEPEAIIWSGRARMYALQTFLVVWALLFLHRSVVEDSPRGRYLFALCFVGALLSQTVTVLLFPALVLGLLAWKGWRWLLKGDVLGPMALAGLGVVVALVLNAVGGPVTSAAQRPFIDPSLGWRLKPGFFFREFFWAWPHLPLTVLLIAGFIGLVWGFVQAQRKGEEAAFVQRKAPLTFLYALFGLSMFQMILLVGESWQRPRYITMLLPIYFLIAAAVVGELLSKLLSTKNLLTAGRWFLCAAAVVLFLPGAWATTRQTEAGYDRALRYLRQRWQPDDLVMTPLPAISGVYLGRCDYYILQHEYEPYLVEGKNGPVDRWMAAPLLNSLSQLKEVLAQGRRVWFVVDDLRWGQRYDPDFRRYVEENMAEAYHQQEVIIFVFTPHTGYLQAQTGDAEAPFSHQAAEILHHPLHLSELG